jgi:hypothetical protein
MKKFKFFIILIFFLTSCGGMKDAGKILRNEKIQSTDEFLVKKRNPLVLPPNYKDIPEPGSISKREQNEEDNIKKILKVPNEDKTSKNKSKSIEDSILNNIRK